MRKTILVVLLLVNPSFLFGSPRLVNLSRPSNLKDVSQSSRQSSQKESREAARDWFAVGYEMSKTIYLVHRLNSIKGGDPVGTRQRIYLQTIIGGLYSAKLHISRRSGFKDAGESIEKYKDAASRLRDLTWGGNYVKFPQEYIDAIQGLNDSIMQKNRGSQNAWYYIAGNLIGVAKVTENGGEMLSIAKQMAEVIVKEPPGVPKTLISQLRQIAKFSTKPAISKDSRDYSEMKRLPDLIFESFVLGK